MAQFLEHAVTHTSEEMSFLFLWAVGGTRGKFSISLVTLVILRGHNFSF